MMHQIIMVSSKNQWVSVGENSLREWVWALEEQVNFLLTSSSHILQNTQIRQVKHCDFSLIYSEAHEGCFV